MPSAPATRLTGWAVLGMLARGPRSGYQIAGALTRGLGGNLFARGPSEAYEEPRRLEALGWAESTVEWQGRRSRRSYRLTAAGRRALGTWFTRPSAPPVVEVEALLKVFFADATPTADPRVPVQEVADWAAQRFREGEQVLARYAAGDNPHQAPLRLVRLVLLANLELTDAFARWAERARRELDEGAPDGVDDLVAELHRRAGH